MFNGEDGPSLSTQIGHSEVRSGVHPAYLGVSLLLASVLTLVPRMGTPSSFETRTLTVTDSVFLGGASIRLL